MVSNQELFKIGNFEFRLHHLLVIGILALSFSVSAMVRSQAADYGFELNEFDPFFNYRATKFIVDNGLDAYFSWHDDMSWHPYGRDVSATSQVMLHITAAALYKVFGFGLSLYDFTIIFPVVFGSFTAIVIFALVRVIGGTTAGLFAALFFSVSAPIIIRGMIGWFKSEPLGLFYALLGIYLFLSGIKHDKGKISFAKLVVGGVFLGFGLSAWGGIQFFIILLGMFFLAIPFVRKDHKFIIWAIPLFALTLILTALSFERPGVSFVLGYGGFILLGPAAFLVISIIIQKFSKEENKIRNNLIFFGGTVIAGLSLILVNAVSLPSFRYLNAINPFLTTEDPLVDSVAEHATSTIELSFYYLSILMIFAGIGIWLLFRKKINSTNSIIKNDMTIFALIIGLLGIYISSAFVRLEVFAAISVIILSSIGLSIITTEIIRKKPNYISNKHEKAIKISYFVIIIALLIVPTTLPANANWIQGIKAPPTLLNGGSTFNIATNDWPDAMEWLKNNTPQDAVVTSWWDYGYWITTLGERRSSADNATLDTLQIKLIAKMFFSPQDEAWKILTSDKLREGLDADYVLIYLTAQRGNDQEPGIYILHGGGDESKKIWIMRIAGEQESKYLHSDGRSGTDFFWQNTLLGQMFPFSVITYGDLQRNLQSDTYKPGFVEIHRLDIKYPADGNGPLRLVYASPSFYRTTAGPISAVLIYEVNKNYKPIQAEIETSVETEEIKEPLESSKVQKSKEIAVITTAFGDITIQFKDEIAPKTVENFKKLAMSGFYDGTIFHRIIPGFVIQGGDPNTISGTSDTWGMGGPDYTIPPEFSNLTHKKYIVSMARGVDINSAGSQFFIVLEDAPLLDGQYTIFGEVVSGQNVVDKIASLETNSLDQPVYPVDAKIEKITVFAP